MGKERSSRTEYWQRRKDRRGQDEGEIKAVIEPWLEKEAEMTRKTGKDDHREITQAEKKEEAGEHHEAG